MEFITNSIIIFVFCCLAAAQNNLSPIGIATQSSTYYSYHASLAITGGPTNDWFTGSCSHTGDNQQAAWWMLTLPNNTLFIEQVKMYYRSDRLFRFDGFSLYLSNTSISGLQKQTPPGVQCYHDVVDGKVSLTKSVACNQMAKYVIVYNENKIPGQKAPYLELCDVQVIGCPKHRFGQECSEMCSSKCVDQHCFPSSGSCVLGCNCLGDDCDKNDFCNAGCRKDFDDICPPRGCQREWQDANCSSDVAQADAMKCTDQDDQDLFLTTWQ